MAEVFGALGALAATGRRVIFPMHPRTVDAVAGNWPLRALLDGVEVVPPVGVFECLSLQRYADVVLTDSGCVQEEAYLLNTPCVTIRENTERHLTVLNGANTLTGFDAATIIRAVRAADAPRRIWPTIYGLPGAGVRIIEIVIDAVHRSPRERGGLAQVADAT
jgi:UDP-N-acetylglucosamine 2-epimerase (non-hydrolysing)